jgi:hypothetical protein
MNLTNIHKYIDYIHYIILLHCKKLLVVKGIFQSKCEFCEKFFFRLVAST